MVCFACEAQLDTSKFGVPGCLGYPLCHDGAEWGKAADGPAKFRAVVLFGV
jgi:hypothetical protein